MWVLLNGSQLLAICRGDDQQVELRGVGGEQVRVCVQYHPAWGEGGLSGNQPRRKELGNPIEAEPAVGSERGKKMGVRDGRADPEEANNKNLK